MGVRNSITIAVVSLTITFLLLAWFFSVRIHFSLIDIVLDTSFSYQLVNTKMSSQFLMKLYFSLMIGSLPFFSWLVLAALKKFKKIKPNLRKYFLVLIILVVSFIVGMVTRVLLLKGFVGHYTEIEGVITSYDVTSFKFYNWGFVVSIIAAFLVFFLQKRIKKMVSL